MKTQKHISQTVPSNRRQRTGTVIHTPVHLCTPSPLSSGFYIYTHSAIKNFLSRHTHIHTHSVWDAIHRVMWWWAGTAWETFFSPLTPRPVYIMWFDARLWNQDSLVHANSWDSATVLCHLIKEELIMLSLTNTVRPYGAWRFFGSSNTVLWVAEEVIFLCDVPRALPTHCIFFFVWFLLSCLKCKRCVYVVERMLSASEFDHRRCWVYAYDFPYDLLLWFWWTSSSAYQSTIESGKP